MHLFEVKLDEIYRAHVERARALKIDVAARVEVVPLRKYLRVIEAAFKELTDEIFAVQREGDEEVIRSPL